MITHLLFCCNALSFICVVNVRSASTAKKLLWSYYDCVDVVFGNYRTRTGYFISLKMMGLGFVVLSQGSDELEIYTFSQLNSVLWHLISVNERTYEIKCPIAEFK